MRPSTPTGVLAAMAAAGLVAGCAAAGATRADLPADLQASWRVLDQVVSARTAVQERNPDAGSIVGTTPAEWTTAPRPGVSGRLLGSRSIQTQRRRVAARLRRLDGTCQVSVTAWIQRYDEGAARVADEAGRDPADLRRESPDDFARGPTWLDVGRDLPLEAEIVAAVESQLPAR